MKAIKILSVILAAFILLCLGIIGSNYFAWPPWVAVICGSLIGSIATNMCLLIWDDAL